MTDLLLLVVVIGLPALVVLGPLAILTLGIAAVADVDGNGLMRPAGTSGRVVQPAPGSFSSDVPAGGSSTRGPAARMSSLTPSA